MSLSIALPSMGWVVFFFFVGRTELHHEMLISILTIFFLFFPLFIILQHLATHPHPMRSLVSMIVTILSMSIPVTSTPTLQLRNGVNLPIVSVGLGLWCNTPKCPYPAAPCADCYNNSAAMADVLMAAGQGFVGVDTVR